MLDSMIAPVSARGPVPAMSGDAPSEGQGRPADAPTPAPGAAPAGPATGVAERPAPSRPAPRELPPFRVILHNDDHNDMLFVVATIVELTPLGKERAVQAMLEAHTSGCVLLLVTHKERAELYADQFRSKGLTATIEPAT